MNRINELMLGLTKSTNLDGVASGMIYVLNFKDCLQFFRKCCRLASSPLSPLSILPGIVDCWNCGTLLETWSCWFCDSFEISWGSFGTRQLVVLKAFGVSWTFCGVSIFFASLKDSLTFFGFFSDFGAFFKLYFMFVGLVNYFRFFKTFPNYCSLFRILDKLPSRTKFSAIIKIYNVRFLTALIICCQDGRH